MQLNLDCDDLFRENNTKQGLSLPFGLILALGCLISIEAWVCGGLVNRAVNWEKK